MAERGCRPIALALLVLLAALLAVTHGDQIRELVPI
jgi:hypothetical protein